MDAAFYKKYHRFSLDIMQNNAKAIISAATTVEPTGVENRIDARIPVAAQITDNTAEQIITLRKLLNTRIAETAGNTISADVSNEPARFIARTIITAHITAISILKTPTLMPVDAAKLSLKVMANIL